jgi:hypothetical protein
VAIKELRATSVPQFVRRVSELGNEWDVELWLRGHEDASWRLTPTLYRYEDPDEAELRIDFQRRAVKLIPGSRPASHWEWYFLMQHYRAPTRLLDWTDGALIALYFAARHDPSKPRTASDIAVWILDPSWLNKRSLQRRTIAISDWEELRPWLHPDPEAEVRKKFPVAVDPVHLEVRMAAQRSHFTIFGKDKRGIEAAAKEDRSARLCKIVLPGGDRKCEQYLDDLAACGIRESTVFPDLEGLARELSEDFAHRGSPRNGRRANRH